MVSIKEIEQKLKKAGMPTDHANAVLQLILDGDISWEEFKETLPSLKDADLDEGFGNLGHSTITRESAEHARGADYTNDLMEWQEGKGYSGNPHSPVYGEKRTFGKILDKWVKKVWEWDSDVAKPKNTTLEQWFLQKYDLNITTDQLNKLITGAAAPSETLLNHLLLSFPNTREIRDSRNFANLAKQTLSTANEVIDTKNSPYIPDVHKQVMVWLAISGITYESFTKKMGYVESSSIYTFPIIPSTIKQTVDFLEKNVPTFSKQSKDTILAAAKNQFPKPRNCQNFSECLLNWRKLCELSQEEFMNKLANRLDRDKFDQSHFKNLCKGIGLSSRILDTMVDIIEEQMKQCEYTELHFTDDDRQKFYEFASKLFPDVTEESNFGKLMFAWRERSGIPLKDFQKMIAEKTREWNTPYTKSMFQRWKKGELLSNRLVGAMADIFEEATKNNKSELFHFKPEDREKFIESSQQYIKQPKQYIKREKNTIKLDENNRPQKEYNNLLSFWLEASNLKQKEFTEKVGIISRRDPYQNTICTQWKKGNFLTAEIISAMADVFMEETQRNKDPQFVFTKEDREAFIESAQQYIKQPTVIKEKSEPEQEKAEPKKFTFVGRLGDLTATASPPWAQHLTRSDQTLSQKIAHEQAQREQPSDERHP